MVYRVLEQRCREWGVPLYISTIDFTKAFGRIKHSALWNSLKFYGVKPAYVRLLQRLDSQQEGTVLTDKESDVFSIKRGTKQGDPLSSLLFNTVLQYSLEDDLKRWQEKRKGIRLSDKTEDCMTNLRFADDVLLFSTSLEKLREMLCEFKASTEAVGLGIHPDKTKILSNQDKKKQMRSRSTTSRLKSWKNRQREILWAEGHVAAWAAVHKYRQELTSKDYRLCHRQSFFNMVVTPTMTYDSGTWTLTLKHEKMIKTAQRKMLRLIVQTKRRYTPKVTTNKKTRALQKRTKKTMKVRPTKKQRKAPSKALKEEFDEEIDATENEENWIDYIKRSTKEAEEHLKKHKIKCWIEVHRKQKWRMERRIIALPAKKRRIVFNWHPGLDTSIRTKRQVGRPKRRWEDDLNEIMKTEEGQEKDKYDLKNNNSWMEEIKDYKKWKENEEKFSKIW